MDEDAARSVKDMWALGDYSRLAGRLEPAAYEIATAVGDGAGRAALDVAAGTGSLSLALASRGWAVTASDIAPALIDRGRARTVQAGFDISWHEAGLDELPFLDGSFDLVGSSFGLIFAPDPTAALDEVHRLLRPGGTLAFSAWTPTSYIAEMTGEMAAFMPPGPAMSDPFRWGDRGVTGSWLGVAFSGVSTRTHTLPWEFPSATEATDFLFENSPGHVAARSSAGDRASAMVRAVHDHFSGLAERDGSVRLAAEYVVTTARRPGPSVIM